MFSIARTTGEHDLHRCAQMLRGFDQKLLAFLRLEPAWIENVIAVLARAQSFGARWRMIERFAVDVVIALQSVGNCLRVGKNFLSFGNEAPVTMVYPFANTHAFGI